MSNIICPSCRSPLTPNAHRQYQCVNGHSFDLAKEGYLNLLLANKKKSSAPGDNDLMIAARRTFLEQGHYAPLVGRINQLLELLDGSQSITRALDVACGEGYYTEKILDASLAKSTTIMGVDISKYAIRKAAKKYKQALFIVASAFDLPIPAHTLDLILSIFGPVDAVSFASALKKNGYLVCVTAGENHLKELALLIYDQFRPHKQNLDDKLKTHFKLEKREAFQFDLDLQSNDQLIALLKMTPYYYNCSQDKMENILKIQALKLTCDFNISIFKPL